MQPDNVKDESRIRIITNNVPRDLIRGYELSEDERKEFDYLDWTIKKHYPTEDDYSLGKGYNEDFFRYKGTLYHVAEFQTTHPNAFNLGLPNEFKNWDGYASDSFFSGLLIRYPRDDRGEPDWDRVIVGLYLS